MANHPKNIKHTVKSPTPSEICAARERAGLTQTEAGMLVHCGLRTWQQWEAGDRRMHPAMWELFWMKICNAHDDLVAALEEFAIEACPHCDATGYEPGTDRNDACHRCGGASEILRGGWPAHVRAALAKAKGAAG